MLFSFFFFCVCFYCLCNSDNFSKPVHLSFFFFFWERVRVRGETLNIILLTFSRSSELIELSSCS